MRGRRAVLLGRSAARKIRTPVVGVKRPQLQSGIIRDAGDSAGIVQHGIPCTDLTSSSPHAGCLKWDEMSEARDRAGRRGVSGRTGLT
jgi:hypothetical protein